MSSPGRLSCEPGRELGGCSARPAPGRGRREAAVGGSPAGEAPRRWRCRRRSWAHTRSSPLALGAPRTGWGGGAFGAADKGCCFEADETRALAAALLADTEGGDVPEATRDLLGFIGSASSASR